MGFWIQKPGQCRAQPSQVAASAPSCFVRSYETLSGQGFWLSRDPIGELGGINLYAIVANAPTNWSDYIGLINCDAEKSRYDSQKSGVDSLKQRIINLKNALMRGISNILNNANLGNLTSDHLPGMSNTDSVPGHVDELETYADALQRAESQLELQQKWLEAAKTAYQDCLKRQNNECDLNRSNLDRAVNLADFGVKFSASVAIGSGATVAIFAPELIPVFAPDMPILIY